ncbi:unnamed protein product [Clonostachys byssicola]|uniref:Uncharacterized protein n=1 Tax=Clonostachys byssicola TaxID=160290 RepID=A0A9N9UFV7_9HYPO|nr:unnamed protein product [Clonostachys byssicola]
MPQIPARDKLESRLAPFLTPEQQELWLPELLRCAGRKRSSRSLLDEIQNSALDQHIAVCFLPERISDECRYRVEKGIFAAFFPSIKQGEEAWRRLDESDKRGR